MKPRGKTSRFPLVLLSVSVLLVQVLLVQGCSGREEKPESEKNKRTSGAMAARQEQSGRGKKNQGAPGEAPGTAPESVPVEAGSPWRADLSSYVFGNTHIESRRSVEVIARAEGQCDNLLVEEGDRVKEAQVLATLDKAELELARREAEVRLENSRSIYERTKRMEAQQLTSEEALENAKYQFETARTQFEKTDLDLRYATIRAPFSGVITKRLIEQGDMVRTGTVLFELAEVNTLLARVYVPEKELGRISLGDRVRLESEMFPGAGFTGRVYMIAPVVDPSTGTVKVTVRVTGNQDKLKPGMFCSAYILTETHVNALVMSRRALVPDVDHTEVYIVDRQGKARRRRVEIGIEQGDTLEVLSGLSDADRMVLVGQESLRDGTPVKVVAGGPDLVERTAGPDSTAADKPPGAKKRMKKPLNKVRSR
ncbi:MAG: efflux RND transporter periplasmic adaptor subunit [Gemmatimonadota bacterium]|nr:efflux RND transporter periplasmic adaptor subunit [Gemmatimonadota bacterium]